MLNKQTGNKYTRGLFFIPGAKTLAQHVGKFATPSKVKSPQLCLAELSPQGDEPRASFGGLIPFIRKQKCLRYMRSYLSPATSRLKSHGFRRRVKGLHWDLKPFILILLTLFLVFACGLTSFSLAQAVEKEIKLGAPPGYENIEPTKILNDSQEEIKSKKEETPNAETNKDFIRWIDLKADVQALRSAIDFCRDWRKKDVFVEFCEVLAYLATKNGNNFSHSTTVANLKKLKTHIQEGGSVSDIYRDNKYYKYYIESYRAIFDGLVGEYTRHVIEEPQGDVSKNDFDSLQIEYGIKGYFPFAKGFWYTHYDDFGASRAYGYKRRHLGHDLMGSVGTPIIAVEGGIITEKGWNRYGGWRIGIRSKDTKRYYYYAHLRKGKPFASGLAVGDEVKAGQVIGFLGHTGYSSKEDTNLKSGEPHLHIGLQIIFDKSQEKGSGEIWVDTYALMKILSLHRPRVVKCPVKNEWVSTEYKESV